MKEAVVQLGLQVGRRGACLIFLALLDLVYAFGLLFPTERSVNNPTTKFLIGIMPLWAWGALWGVVGLVCLVFAFRRKDRIGYAAAMILTAFWAAVFLFGWLFADIERGYLSAAIWGAFAAFVWIHADWQENPVEES